jgi:hypothetical protein
MKLTTHFHLVPRSRKRETIPPLPNTLSCRGAQLKHSDNFTFAFICKFSNTRDGGVKLKFSCSFSKYLRTNMTVQLCIIILCVWKHLLSPISWYGIFIRQLIVTELDQKFLLLWNSRIHQSIHKVLCQPKELSPHIHTLRLMTRFTTSPHLHLTIRSTVFPWGFRTNFCLQFSFFFYSQQN